MSNLATIKIGDVLIHYHNFNQRAVVTVARLTKTQLIADNGDRFNRNSGYVIGKGCNFVGCPKPGEVDEILLEAHRRKLISSVLNKVNRQELTKWTTEALVNLHQQIVTYQKETSTRDKHV